MVNEPIDSNMMTIINVDHTCARTDDPGSSSSVHSFNW